MTKQRFPRKAKKWAKKNGVRLTYIKGKRYYGYTTSMPYWVSRGYGNGR